MTTHGVRRAPFQCTPLHRQSPRPSSLRASSRSVFSPLLLDLSEQLSFDSLSSLQYDLESKSTGAASLSKGASSAPPPSLPEVNLPEIDWASLLPAVGVLAVGVGVIAGAVQLLSNASGSKVQGISAQAAFQRLAEDDDLQLIDIRTKNISRKEGTPDLSAVGKSPIALAYRPSIGKQALTSTISIGWADRLKRMSKLKNSSTILFLDADGSIAPQAAAEAIDASAEFERFLYVSGGTTAWLQDELPWKDPFKLGINMDTLKAIDISGVAKSTEGLVQKYNSNPTIVNGALAAFGVAGASVFLFSEIEAILQIVGLGFALQFLAKKLLFAENRRETLRGLQSLIQDKIAAGQAPKDLRRLADKLLDVDEYLEEEAARQATGQVEVAAVAPAPGAQNGSVAPNVKEARKWIAAWRTKSKARAPVKV